MQAARTSTCFSKIKKRRPFFVSGKAQLFTAGTSPEIYFLKVDYYKSEGESTRQSAPTTQLLQAMCRYRVGLFLMKRIIEKLAAPSFFRALVGTPTGNLSAILRQLAR